MKSIIISLIFEERIVPFYLLFIHLSELHLQGLIMLGSPIECNSGDDHPWYNKTVVCKLNVKNACWDGKTKVNNNGSYHAI